MGCFQSQANKKKPAINTNKSIVLGQVQSKVKNYQTPMNKLHEYDEQKKSIASIRGQPPAYGKTTYQSSLKNIKTNQRIQSFKNIQQMKRNYQQFKSLGLRDIIIKQEIRQKPVIEKMDYVNHRSA